MRSPLDSIMDVPLPPVMIHTSDGCRTSPSTRNVSAKSVARENSCYYYSTFYPQQQQVNNRSNRSLSNDGHVSVMPDLQRKLSGASMVSYLSGASAAVTGVGNNNSSRPLSRNKSTTSTASSLSTTTTNQQQQGRSNGVYVNNTCSYVTTLRRQKATVWSDRLQVEPSASKGKKSSKSSSSSSKPSLPHHHHHHIGQRTPTMDSRHVYARPPPQRLLSTEVNDEDLNNRPQTLSSPNRPTTACSYKSSTTPSPQAESAQSGAPWELGSSRLSYSSESNSLNSNGGATGLSRTASIGTVVECPTRIGGQRKMRLFIANPDANIEEDEDEKVSNPSTTSTTQEDDQEAEAKSKSHQKYHHNNLQQVPLGPVVPDEAQKQPPPPPKEPALSPTWSEDSGGINPTSTTDAMLDDLMRLASSLELAPQDMQRLKDGNQSSSSSDRNDGHVDDENFPIRPLSVNMVSSSHRLSRPIKVKRRPVPQSDPADDSASADTNKTTKIDQPHDDYTSNTSNNSLLLE